MIANRSRSVSLFVVYALVCVTAMVTVKGLWQTNNGNGWTETIRSDAMGYYGYLQAIFIRHDLGHEPFINEYTQYAANGRTLNKYFCGTGIMMAPWFAIGHALAVNDPGVPQDGTSVYEQKAIAIGAWVYLLMGLLALRALLLGSGVRDGLVAWVLAGLALGTPLIQYAAIQPGWSHVYSFCLVSVFLLMVHRIAIGGSLRNVLAAAALLGLIILVRPVNAVVILAVPIVAGPNTRTLFTRLFANPRWLAGSIFLSMVIVATQPVLWFAQTGNFLEWGYTSEGFYWTRPEVLKVLFGFRRGLFLWTPLMLFVVICTVLLWRTDRQRSAWALAYWAVITYIISCWWIWYYGGGFGSRVYIEHFPLLVLPFALVLQQWSKRLVSAARVLIFLCIGLNLAQLWQYHNDILHQVCMDRRMYQFTFLRFDADHTNKLGGNYQEAPYHPKGMRPIITESWDLDHPPRYWSGKPSDHPRAFSLNKVVAFNAQEEFALAFKAGTDTLPTGTWLFLEIGLQRFEATKEASLPILGVTAVVNAEGKEVFYSSFPINALPGTPGVWEQLEYRIPVPPLQKGDELNFHFWNRDRKGTALIDDVFMRVSAVNPF